jgi:hypothetical protein
VEAKRKEIDKRCGDIIEANELLNDIAAKIEELDRTERFGMSDSSSSQLITPANSNFLVMSTKEGGGVGEKDRLICIYPAIDSCYQVHLSLSC